MIEQPGEKKPALTIVSNPGPPPSWRAVMLVIGLLGGYLAVP